MNLKELLDIAAKGYDQTGPFMSTLYDDQGNNTGSYHQSGDGLAYFIVTELRETFQEEEVDEDGEKFGDLEQLQLAISMMEQAAEEVHEVINALYQEWSTRANR